MNEQSAARAAVDTSEARVRDAKLDLEYTRVTAPFTGRMSARQVSLGGLIAGSRAGASATTLLATIVSLDPIYLDFDMSERLAEVPAQPRPEAAALEDRHGRARRRGRLRPDGQARLRRQRPESFQRHHPRPRHLRQPDLFPVSRPVCPRARRALEAHAGAARSRRGRAARPVGLRRHDRRRRRRRDPERRSRSATCATAAGDPLGARADRPRHRRRHRAGAPWTKVSANRPRSPSLPSRTNGAFTHSNGRGAS